MNFKDHLIIYSEIMRLIEVEIKHKLKRGKENELSI